MSADVTPIRTLMNTYGQTIGLHLAGFSTLLGAPAAALRARRARTSSIPPAPLAAPAPAEVTATDAMKLARTDSETECRLAIDGVLDVHSSPELRAVFESVVAAQPKRVVVDLAGLTMLDSSGVGAIVSLFKRVKNAGGSFALIGVCGQPAAVCRLLKLDRVFGL